MDSSDPSGRDASAATNFESLMTLGAAASDHRDGLLHQQQQGGGGGYGGDGGGSRSSSAVNGGAGGGLDVIAAAVAAGEHEAAASRGPSHASGVDADHNASSPNRSASYGAQRSISTSSARRGGAARGGATLSSTAGASGRRKRRMSEAQQQQQQAYGGGGGEMDTPQSEFDGWGAGAGDDGDGGDDDGDGEGEDGGKRRIQRACDLCRRKKIRCDGAVGTGPKGAKRNIRCSNCTEAGASCTYVEHAKRRGPPPGYLETLEFKVGRLEDLVRRVAPSVDLVAEVGPSVDRESFDLPSFKRQLNELGIPFGVQSGRTKAARVLAEAEAVSDSQTPSASKRGRKSKAAMQQQQEAAAAAAMVDPALLDEKPMDALKAMQDDQERLARLFASHVLDSNGALAVTDASPAVTLADQEHEMQQTPAAETETPSSDNPLMSQMSEVNLAEGYRYHGKSSGVQLLRTVMDYKFASAEDSAARQSMVASAHSSRRPEYWSLPKWEAEVSQGATEPLDLSLWPEPDLCEKLIDAYFSTDNLVLPLLSRTLLMRDYHAGRWRTDRLFAKVCLMVFANAARFVDDPRCYWYADDESKAREAMLSNPEVYRHSAGWKWCEMVIKMGKSFLVVAVLEDLQVYVLLAQFLMRSAVISTVWAISGLGIKACQDIGIHTKAAAGRFATRAEAELYKRAFWCCVYLDRITSAAMGRTVTLQDEDFDAEYPLAVDDEFWETGSPHTDFVQPPGVPSKISLFVTLLKLTRIVANVLKTVYAVNRTTKDRNLDDPAVQKKIVAELDSDLYSWLDAMPEHLRWDPQRKDPTAFEQSCVVYGMFYFVQILIHRPFIPTPHKTSQNVSSLAFPSLAICTNAARSCSHLVEAQAQRSRPNYHMLLPTFTSAIVLLIGVWGGRKAGGTGGDSAVALGDVRKCLHALRDAEKTWRGAGRMRDVLMELASISETSLSTPGSRASPASTSNNNGGSKSAEESESGRKGRSAQMQQGRGTHVSDIRSQPTSAGSQPSPSQPWFMQPNAGLAPPPANPSAPAAPSSGGAPWSAPLVSSQPSFTRSTVDGTSAAGNLGGVEYPISLPPQAPEITTSALPFINHAANPVPPELATADLLALQQQGAPQIAGAPPAIAFANGGSPYPAVFDTTWPYPNFDPAGWEMNQAMNYIWSMAPGAFEMDQWSNYLEQTQPGQPGSSQAAQNARQSQNLQLPQQ